MSKKTILLIVAPVLFALVAIVWYFFGMQNQKSDPWLFIPDNPAMIFQIDKPDQFLYHIEKNSDVWHSLLKAGGVEDIHKQALYVDSLFKNNLTINQLLADPLLVSVHYDTAFNQIQVLFITSVKIDVSIELLESSLDDHFEIITRGSEKIKATIKSIQNGSSVEIGFRDNIVVVSTDSWLVNRALKSGAEQGPHFSKDDSFRQIRETAGKKVDAKMFLNYKYFSSLLTHFVVKYDTKAILWLEEFAAWTETDILIKEDEIIMTGFTSATPSSYLGKYSKQSAVKSQVSSVVPSNANVLLAISFSDINSVVQTGNIAALSGAVNYDLQNLLNVLGQEIAYASNSNSSNKIDNNSWFIAKLKDKDQARNILKLIAKNTNGAYFKKDDLEMGEIRQNNFVPDLFGKSFGNISHTWFTFIDDYVIFGNSSESLTQLNLFFSTGKTLDVNDYFKEFSDNLSSKSNVLLYIKPKDLTGTFKNYLNKETVDLLQENIAVVKDFDGIAFQFTSNDSLFYTSFYLKTDQSFHEESLAQWKVQLDDKVAGKPFLVKDPRTNTYYILAFDIQSNLYQISEDGQINWKKRIDALPQSNIFQIDYFKNNKIQYLFNTTDFIYVIDRDGNLVENFPKKLNPSATNGLNLFDYENNKDYRILIAQADKKVHNYKINASPVDGWKLPKTQNIVADPAFHMMVKKKDYILLTDIDNNVTIVNRKGEERIKLKENPDKARHSEFYVNNTNNKGIIITSNTRGKLVYITPQGKLSYTDFGDYSADHYFMYEDFNGDNDKDFIYVDGKKLTVFDRFKNILFSYEFPSAITIKPQYFKLSNRENVLGIVDAESRIIYLFDKKGNTLVSTGLLGETPFTVGSLKNNSEVNLITGVDNMIYNYQIK